MASPNTLKLRQPKHYDKNGRPTRLLFHEKLIEQRRKRWEDKHGKAVQDKAAREIETGIKDARSATA